MPDQQVLWTALPRSATGDALELEVFVSPRLGVDAAAGTELALSDFPEWEHWPQTLDTRLSFELELADGTRHAATVVAPAALDQDTWDHLFRATTFVRPWTFRDLSDRQIHSYPTRFVLAYLKALYAQIGKDSPTAPPPRSALDGARQTLGPLTDVRVGDERAAPPRSPTPLPEPPETPPDEPPPEGCLTWLLALIERLCRSLEPLYRRLPRLVRFVLGLLFALLKRVVDQMEASPPDPTKPKVSLTRVVHPSPYQAKPPLGSPSLPFLDQLEQEMAANLVVAPSPAQGAMSAALANRSTSYDFARAKRFFERDEVPNPTPHDEPSPTIPRLDFHQALGALGDYPELLRRLGVVVRLRVDRPATDPGSVRVVPLWDGATRTTDIAPRTRCTLSGDRFAAAHRAGSEFRDGLLELSGADDRLATDTPQFDVVQVDADGAAIKALLLAASLERLHQLDVLNVHAIDRPATDTTPALRSAGLAVVRADRAWYLHQNLVAAAAQTPQPAPAPADPADFPQELWAEDLVRGYRVEVSADGGPWLSLCSRVGTYDLVDDTGQLVKRALEHTDEGYVKRTSGSSQGDAQPLYVGETLVRWTGWSLVAQRPGKTLENDVDGTRTPPEKYDEPRPPRDEVHTEFRIITTFKAVPGSLPRLRFGTTYRLRALCVDLSAELLADPLADAPATAPVTYLRFEPAGPPAALALRGFRPGESLERLVLRSDYDRDNPTYDTDPSSPFPQAPADADAQRTRHLFPPKTSQQMAELHGKLDAAFAAGGAAGDPSAGYALSLRESGTFSNPKVAPFGTPTLVGDLWTNAADETLTTPYLADPIVAGAALRGVPGVTNQTDVDGLPVHQVDNGLGGTEALLQIPYAGDWPDLEAFRLRVAEQTSGGQPPTWSASARLLTVYLPKAGRAQVRYSSYVGDGQLDHHGMWDWVGPDDPTGALRAQADSGAHWMLTPARTLVLVHATQRPLETSHFAQLTAARTQLGQTDAQLENGVLQLDVPSTGRIDVLASWTEWLDDPVTGVDEAPRQAVACDFVVDPDTWVDGMAFPPPNPLPRARQQFGDTRRRDVTYGVRATTSFREYFEAPAPELTRDTPPAQLVTTIVPSSARPIAPTVLYAVPAFTWRNETVAPDWQQQTETRVGGGLRVFLDRPWYQSGAGELLGILLATANEPLPDTLRSRYGLDPIWSGPVDPNAVELVPSHFPGRAAERTVTLAEPDPATGAQLTAQVVGFEPVWDADRRRWICDIELDLDLLPWSASPFVRFAFVRFQPESLDGAHVSKVVLGEFGLVAPGRSLSVTWQGDQQVHVALTGQAPSVPFAPRVAFRVQTTGVPTAQTADELDWTWAAGDEPDINDLVTFETLTAAAPGPDDTVTWERDVALPAVRGSATMRLEVVEYEFLRADVRDFGRGLPRVIFAAHIGLD
jgi:hypothetical protein